MTMKTAQPKSASEVEEAEKEIREMSIPYHYDTKEYPIEVVSYKFKQGELVKPNYQRDLEWDEKMQSRFIESLFLGVPIPPLFLAVLEDGSLEIIDGLQRISTIDKFLNDRLTLKGVEGIEILNGFKFSDLHPSRQKKFNLITIRFHVVTDKADLPIRADVFDRLNSTGKKLVPSQVRKGAYATNVFYQFVLELVQSSDFQQLYTGKEKEAEADELVLRYFVYADRYLEFKHDVAIFLNRSIELIAEKGFDRLQKESEFKTMLAFVKSYFPNGFSKKDGNKAIPRVRFEAISVGVHLALRENPHLHPTYMNWLDSFEFKKHTTSDASNNQGKLRTRVEFVRDCLLNKITEQELNFS
ncbi:MAG: DUF262 domain-containing protein [Runella slithyformis]|nr:MAG: DUF262 domain-containing protein [Runella slithyformis]TAF48228.1 MAG: DUF262 domain-containing protein [Runella slithyformis]